MNPLEPIKLTPGFPVAQFELGSQRNFVYLVIDWTAKCAALVDNQKGVAGLISKLAEQGIKLTHVLLTHAHPDHSAGLPELAKLLPDLKYFYHPAEQERLDKTFGQEFFKNLNVRTIGDGASIELGPDVTLKCLHTPGHTSGAISYLSEATDPPFILSGDFLFIRDCGRTDLPSGDDTDMFKSVQRIKALSPETLLLPGHHYARECFSVMAEEFKRSPPLQCKTVEELTRLA